MNDDISLYRVPTNIENITEYKQGNWQIKLIHTLEIAIKKRDTELIVSTINKLSELPIRIKTNLSIFFLCETLNKPVLEYGNTFKLVLKYLLQADIDPNIFLYPDYSFSRCYINNPDDPDDQVDNIIRRNNEMIEFYHRVKIYKRDYLPLTKDVINKFYNLIGLNQKIPDDLVDYTKSFLTGIQPKRFNRSPPGSPKMGFRPKRLNSPPRRNKKKSR